MHSFMDSLYVCKNKQEMILVDDEMSNGKHINKNSNRIHVAEENRTLNGVKSLQIKSY